MKKYFIILLAVLLLFTFASCSKDKSEEVRAEYEEKLKAEEEKQASIVKNYEDFCEAYKAAEFIWEMYRYKNKINADGTYQIENFEDYTLHEDEARYLVTLSEGTVPDAGDVDFKSGTVEVDNYSEAAFYSNKDLDFTDNQLTVKYNSGSEKKSAEITLSGTLSVTVGATEKTVEVNLTVGDKTYNASWTIISSKFTRAKVNGQEVELRLLNRAIKL